VKIIPIVTKVVKIQTGIKLLHHLPIGYPVEVVRDWNHGLHPYAMGVWVHSFTERVLLGYLPDSIATLIATDMAEGKVVSSRILQYMRVNEAYLPVITVKIDVKE
jgi:hypothetical protein